MEKRELTCIGCPLGCAITVEMNDKEIVSVTGYTCARGEAYARKEVTNPTRVVTSIVKVKDNKKKTVSVKTKEDIPKEKIFAVMDELKGVEMTAPIKIGDIVVDNVAGTGVPVVATKNII